MRVMSHVNKTESHLIHNYKSNEEKYTELGARVVRDSKELTKHNADGATISTMKFL